MKTHIRIQAIRDLMDITAGNDFLGIYDQKSLYKHVFFWIVTELWPAACNLE